MKRIYLDSEGNYYPEAYFQVPVDSVLIEVENYPDFYTHRYVNGEFVQRDDAADINAERQALRLQSQWAHIRTERDARIAKTDWTQLPDSPLNSEQIEAYKAYRQALRDIPQSQPSPREITWPSPPEP